MIRRVLCYVACPGYSSPSMAARNIRAWWSRRGGWIVNSLLLDEVFQLRCMRALEGGAA
jgi:hypothetical protein